MKRKIAGIFICILMIIVAILPATGTIYNRELLNEIPTMEFAPGEIIVKLKKNTAFQRDALMILNKQHQVNTIEKLYPNAKDTILDNIYILHVPRRTNIPSIVQEYRSCPDVVYAEPNGIAYPCSIPNDPEFSNQWFLQNTGQVISIPKLYNWNLNMNLIRFRISGIPDTDIDAPEAWEIETGDPTVVIAIIDSGIDYTHPDLTANIWNNVDELPNNDIDDDLNGYIDDVMGWNFANHDNDPKDGYFHGTICAGVAAAVGNNSIGKTGVCWNCKIMPLQVINETAGGASWQNIATAFKYAADNGAKIISISLGDTESSNILLDAVNYAHSKGVFLCAAAGNSNTNTKLYPAAYDNITAVGMTNIKDKRVHFLSIYGSNYGDWVDIAAPGYWILSTTPTYRCTIPVVPNYDFFCGTSLAAPMVAGVAALLLSKDPSLTPDEVKALLCENVDPYTGDHYIGTGRLNAYKALFALT